MWLGLFIILFITLLFQIARWDELNEEFKDLQIELEEKKDAYEQMREELDNEHII